MPVEVDNIPNNEPETSCSYYHWASGIASFSFKKSEYVRNSILQHRRDNFLSSLLLIFLAMYLSQLAVAAKYE